MPSTLQDLLRRGRGNGFRRALAAGPSAAENVLSCVLDDPRWDRQVESRDLYYASLLLELSADIGPICERLLSKSAEREESDFWLPIGVLGAMARRGHDPARDGLAKAIHDGLRA